MTMVVYEVLDVPVLDPDGRAVEARWVTRFEFTLRWLVNDMTYEGIHAGPVAYACDHHTFQSLVRRYRFRKASRDSRIAIRAITKLWFHVAVTPTRTDKPTINGARQ